MREIARGNVEWSGTVSGQSGDYNLEAYVSAERTLADHLAEQLAFAIADPVRRMIGQYLIDLVEDTGYLNGDVAAISDRLGAPQRAKSKPSWRSCKGSTPRACARAISRNASPSSSRNATASILRWRNWSLISTCWPKRDLAALRKLCDVSEEDLDRHDR